MLQTLTSLSLVRRLSCDVKAVKNLIYDKKRTYNKIVINASLEKERPVFIFIAIFGKKSLLFDIVVGSFSSFNFEVYFLFIRLIGEP